MPETTRHQDKLMRGVVVNAAGLTARLIEPLFVIAITWMFGPAVVGVYFVALFTRDMVASFVTTGYEDAVTIFVSRDADRDDGASHDRMYTSLANAFALTAGASAIAIGAAYLGAGWLGATVFREQPGVAAALLVLAWSIPPTAVAKIALAATKAEMRMEYDAAITGFVRPAILLVLAVASWFWDQGLQGLMFAHLGAQLAVAILALWALARHFRIRMLLGALRAWRFRRDMLVFAFPQSLNMTLNQYITKLDVLMLAGFGFAPAQVAFYGTASLITSNLRQVRLVFTTALAPIAARHHGAGEREILEDTVGRVSRWTTTIVVPLVLLVIVFRNDLLRLFHSSYGGDTGFMVVLLVAPLLNVAFGVAGNCIVYTGHSGWNLFNSIAIGAINTVLNLVLIPRYGLVGAATATAVAVGIVTVMRLVELFLLERIVLRMRYMSGATAGLAAALGLLVLVWDPSALALGERVMVGAIALVMFVGGAWLAGHDEIRRYLSLGVRRLSS